jgi:hypothetical protein
MKKLALCCGVVLISACATEPSVDTSSDAQLSYDGLSPISNSRFRQAWVDPDVDLKKYNQLIMGNAEFEFRAVRDRGGSTMSRRKNQTEFWISDADKQRLTDEVSGAFREELANVSGFTFTEERGPNALILVGALHDIVSNVPPDMVQRSEVWLSSVGEATLIIEGRDSLSGETIFRAVDRRRAEQVGDQVIRSNSVTTWVEVRRLARRWAVRLREGLEAIHE